MKFCLSWLKEHLDTTARVDEIAETLTKIGLEVEEVFNPASKLDGFVTAKVEDVEMHPDSDHLHILRVNNGKEILQIVCGAPNVRKGMVGVLAPVGVVIPVYNEVMKVGKIRGVESLYNGYCGGGNGAGYNNSYNDRTYGTPEYWLSSSIKQYGLDGIIVIKYLKAKSGGKGGNSGKKVTKTISVNPNETYKIIVGDGSNGAKSKYISSSGTVVQSVPAETIKHSYIYKDGIKILGTDDTNATFQDSISSTSLLGSKGAALSGVSTCYVGDGGTLESQDGTAALGYGGCGGGGGYGLANGGKGACGYVLLEWEELQE